MHTFRKYFLPFLLVFIAVAGGTFAVIKVLDSHENQVDNVVDEPAPEEIIEEEPVPDFIDLQPVVDEWISTARYKQASVAIYDLDNDRYAAFYNTDTAMRPASLYKLFYVYDGYKYIDAGVDDPAELYANLGGERGWTSVIDCLDLMISESNNICAEKMLAEDKRADRVAAWIQELGLTRTEPSGLMTSGADLVQVMKMYYYHPDWSDKSFAAWQTSALNQKTATTDYRIGLPSGFDEQAIVYNKVGWANSTGYWEVYNDAAIIEFPNLKIPRHYIVVIMTNSAGYSQIAEFGTMLEEAILSFETSDEINEATDNGTTERETEAIEEGSTGLVVPGRE